MNFKLPDLPSDVRARVGWHYRLTRPTGTSICRLNAWYGDVPIVSWIGRCSTRWHGDTGYAISSGAHNRDFQDAVDPLDLWWPDTLANVGGYGPISGTWATLYDLSALDNSPAALLLDQVGVWQ